MAARVKAVAFVNRSTARDRPTFDRPVPDITRRTTHRAGFAKTRSER